MRISDWSSDVCSSDLNPNFCRSALAAYTPRDFIDLVEKHGIAWHDKHRGQLFCDESSEAIIAMLKSECDVGRVSWRLPCKVDGIVHEEGRFKRQTTIGSGSCRARGLK